jgi:hypothetical protein
MFATRPTHLIYLSCRLSLPRTPPISFLYHVAYVCQTSLPSHSSPVSTMFATCPSHFIPLPCRVFDTRPYHLLSLSCPLCLPHVPSV